MKLSKIEIIMIICIIASVIVLYDYSSKMLSGLLEQQWLEETIISNKNLRMLLGLSLIGGGLGYSVSWLIKKVKKNVR